MSNHPVMDKAFHRNHGSLMRVSEDCYNRGREFEAKLSASLSALNLCKMALTAECHEQMLTYRSEALEAIAKLKVIL